MEVRQIGSGPLHAAPVPGGPIAELVVGEGESRRLSVARVEVPPGVGMPEHDHAGSEAVILCQGGTVVISSSGQQVTLRSGTVAVIGVGERVSVHNPGSETAVLLGMFTPGDFVTQLAAWPRATGAATS